MATIGENLIAARRAKGMTQDELARALNLSRPTISHWERNRTQPDAATLLKLSRLLDYSFEMESAWPNEPQAQFDPAPTG